MTENRESLSGNSDYDAFLLERFEALRQSAITRISALPGNFDERMAAWLSQSSLLWKSIHREYQCGLSAWRIEESLLNSRFAFQAALTYANALPNNKRRLAFFLTAQTDFNQWVKLKQPSDSGLLYSGVLEYDERCQREIDKYARLCRLDAELPEEEKKARKKRSDLTIDRAILLIDAIGGSRLKAADREKLAEVVAFLTGDDPESVRQRYSKLNPENGGYKGHTESGMKALLEDLRILSYYFDLIGLRGELNKLSDKLGIPLTK